jgi:hypothetical protein
MAPKTGGKNAAEFETRIQRAYLYGVHRLDKDTRDCGKAIYQSSEQSQAQVRPTFALIIAMKNARWAKSVLFSLNWASPSLGAPAINAGNLDYGKANAES